MEYRHLVKFIQSKYDEMEALDMLGLISREESSGRMAILTDLMKYGMVTWEEVQRDPDRTSLKAALESLDEEPQWREPHWVD